MIQALQMLNFYETRFFDVNLEIKNIETDDDWSGFSSKSNYQIVDVLGVKQQYDYMNDPNLLAKC